MSKSHLPLVSFAIPSYNHERYISEMLDSCIAQTYPNIEIIIVDDASTDNSRLVIEEYAQRYPKIVRAEFNATNLGQALTARNAVKLTQGDYIAGIGSDDVSLPHRIASGVEILMSNPTLGAVFSKAEIIDEASRTIDSPVAEVFNCECDDIRWRLLSGNFLCGPSMLARGDLIRNVSPNPNLRYVEDFDQSLRILDTHELLRVDEVWVKYRSHGKNLSINALDNIPFAGNYETAICILSALSRWPIEKLFSFKSPEGTFEHKRERALAHCSLARHCIQMDDALFGRPFLLTSEAYRQLLIATENDPRNDQALELFSEVWRRLGDHSRALGKKPIAFVDWQNQQKNVAPASDNGPNFASTSYHAPDSTDVDRSSTQQRRYQQWQLNRTRIAGEVLVTVRDESQVNSLLNFQLCIRLAKGQESALADTIDSLSCQHHQNWHLDIVTDLATPDSMDNISCIGWHRASCEEHKFIIDQLVAQRECDWCIEIPPGVKLDPLYLWRLSAEIYADPTKRCFFVDDDCFDTANHRFAPRFKPGCNPSALESSDLAGPICISRETWISVDGCTSASGSPWFAQLLKTAKKFGWGSIKHIPDMLISYPEQFPTNTEACLTALLEHIDYNTTKSEIVAATPRSWNIRHGLDSTPKVTIVIISTGQLDMLSRCHDSLLKNTSYKNIELLISIDEHHIDPDTKSWLNKINNDVLCTRKIISRSKNKPNHASLCNAAINSADGELIILIKENCVVIQNNWLDELVRTAMQPGIAGVSPRIIQPGTALVENSGSILGLNGIADSPYREEAKLSEPGYLDSISVTHDVSALYPSCMMTHKSSYQQAGGMDDESFGNYFSHLDLSIKLRKNGGRLIYQPLSNIVDCEFSRSSFDKNSISIAERLKSEAQARNLLFKKWKNEVAVDPYWNKNLSLCKLTPEVEVDYIADWNITPTKLPRIFANPISNGQGDFRITSPLNALRRAGLASACIWRQAMGNPRYHSASEMLRLSPDAIIVQNYIHDTALSALDNWDSTKCRPFTVYTLDDLITEMDSSNPFRKYIPANSRARLKYALERCDRLVVSTDYLAESYKNLCADIKIVPNRLEQTIWLPLHSKKRVATRPRIGWAGGSTHQGDLLMLKEIIEQTRHEADWIFFGMCPDEIKPLLAEYHPLIRFEEYPAHLASLSFDIAVAPLTQTAFNRGKSNLRLLEYGILGIPVVCTDIEPYKNSPACKVSNFVQAWVEAIRARIHDPEAREREGAELRRWVLNGFLLENHLAEWLDAHTQSSS